MNPFARPRCHLLFVCVESMNILSSHIYDFMMFQIFKEIYI